MIVLMQLDSGEANEYTIDNLVKSTGIDSDSLKLSLETLVK
jgi:hypothetical protein